MNVRVTLTPPNTLILAVRRILRPLARLLIAQGIDYTYFSRLAKAVFVESAAHDFPDSEEAVTDSRVSLLSGVHRREVKRLRNETVEHTPPASVSMGAQLAARWCALYPDAARKPRPLPRTAPNDAEASFERLVSDVSKDIRPRAVLDEWLNLGVARLDEQDRVHLVESAFIPEHGFDEKAFYFGKGLHDHLAAASGNLLGQRPPCLDRVAYYDALSVESETQLRELARQLALNALQEFNRRALELQSADADKPEARRRVSFGAYFFSPGDVSPPDGEHKG